MAHFRFVFRYLCNMNTRFAGLSPLLLGLMVMIGALVLGSCATQREGCNYKAVVTIEPLRFFAEQLAGPRWEIKTIVPKGFSPEEFMPTVKQMAEVAEACCLFKVGNLGFETTMLSDAEVMGEGLRVADTSEGLGASGLDPHTWTSPSGALTICRNITKTLVELDPANAKEYQERLHVTTECIQSLDSLLRSLTKDLPSRSFVIAHPALSRFASDYGLRQIAIESEGKEPTPNSIRTLVALAKREDVRVIFVQQEFSENTALVVASETGAHLVCVNPLAYEWPEQLLLIAKSLRDGQTDATTD